MLPAIVVGVILFAFLFPRFVRRVDKPPHAPWMLWPATTDKEAR